MSKELESALRVAGLCLVFALVLFVALKRIHRLEDRIRELENAPADTVTVIRHDTIKIDSPVPVIKYIKEKEYVTVTDSLLVHDTVTHIVELPREYLVYQDTTYRAVVSGVQPRLDTIAIYPKTVYQTITKTITKTKKTKWGIGVQAGCGWNGEKFSPYLGAGVQYNLISF